MKLADFIVEPQVPILETLKKIDKNGRGIIYVCSSGRLLAVLTDGDIRRHILSNGDLNLDVQRIANKSPRYVLNEENTNVRDFMKKNLITSVPIVDNEMVLLEIEFLDKTFSECKPKLNLPVVIMAGGKGSRLYPYTQILPKPLIPIGEQTITEHIMDRFEAFGCRHFDMLINYKKNFIKAYFQDNENMRDVSFIEEKEFLGTGGGLKLLSGHFQSTFFMSNCDILIEENYAKISEYHQKNQNLITMVCAVKNMTIPYGTVDISETGLAVRINEKPNLSFITNTGFYVIEPEFINEIPDNTFIHITDIIQACIDGGKRVGVYPIDEEHWMDMGQLDELERMRRHLKQGERRE